MTLFARFYILHFYLHDVIDGVTDRPKESWITFFLKITVFITNSNNAQMKQKRKRADVTGSSGSVPY